MKNLELACEFGSCPIRVDLIVTESSIAPASDALVETLGVAAESSAPKGRSRTLAVKPAPTDLSREVEVKFMTDAKGFKAALASPLFHSTGAASPARKLTTIYFDTAESDLQQRRIALRVRRDGRKAPVMTLKWIPAASEGPFSRGEIEIPARGLLPDLSRFGGEMGELVRRSGRRQAAGGQIRDPRLAHPAVGQIAAPPESRRPSTRARSSLASAHALCAKSSWN